MNSQDVLSKDEYRFQNCCDCCGHLASYAAVRNDQTLLFCLHHFTMNSTALLNTGWTFVERNEFDRAEKVSV